MPNQPNPESAKVKRRWSQFRIFVSKQSNPTLDQLAAGCSRVQEDSNRAPALQLLQQFIDKTDQYSEREDLPGNLETKLRDQMGKIRPAMVDAGQVCGTT